MLDLLMLLLLGIAFAGAVLYVRACFGLTRSNGTATDKAP